MNAGSNPLRFNSPPGWPQPNSDWQLFNQGWIPPHNWTPVPNVPPAPPTWTFWVKNELAWNELVRVKRAPFVKRFWIWLGVAAAGAVFTAITFQAATSSGSSQYYIFGGAMIFGVIRAIIALIQIATATNGLENEVIRFTQSQRTQLLRAMYQEYLTQK